MTLAPGDRPALWRLARLQYDDVRGQTALLYPEGLLLLNESGTAILTLCDGSRSIEQISTELSARVGQDVRADVVEYLEALVDRGLVRLTRADS